MFLKTILRVSLVIAAVGWALNVPSRLGIALFTEQLLAVSLGLAIALVILDQEKPSYPLLARWALWASALGAVGLTIYIASIFATIPMQIAMRPVGLSIVTGVLVLLTISALYLTSGVGIFAVVSLFIAYACFGHFLPDPIGSRDYGITRVALYLGGDPNGILGAPLKVAISIVLPYVLFGRLLTLFGGAAFFTDLASSLMSRFRGGEAKVAILASALFGTISGSAVGNVVSTGVVTIPLMERSGYKPKEAGAIEAVASTGGQLMPPVLGATAFLMAEFLAIPYTTVVAASIIPCFFYFGSLFLQVDLLAGKRKLNAGASREIPKFGKTFAEGWHFLLPFAAIFFCLFELNMRPEVAALSAIVVLLAVGFIRGYRGVRPELKTVVHGFIVTGDASKEILIITAAAGIVIGVLNLTGVSFSITQSLISLTGGSIVLMLLAAAALNIILGMGMPTVGVYVLLATLVGPPLIELGIEPIAAHMFILYFGLLSMVTPPVALASFAAAQIANADPWQTSWTSMRFAWVAYIVPFLFVGAPQLLMLGTLVEIAHVSITAAIGIFSIQVGAVGFLRREVGLLSRLACVAGGIACMIPVNIFPMAGWVEATGFLLVLLGLAGQLRPHARAADVRA
ncbi:C4-dicarboxylate ABC transporter permease [Phyllobacterium salinisoli]|uniref:C4-dicarboxylate ABC transporter permease n=1 Tax=Phyllobacterium salinisoli TaxID=1899321 RepID=A0A368JWZ3_9HYPH|nr:TRAP transporter fused permease subunit [Phyllobacterium salinisoli]RCS21688.1 C4-dicarboxylate ABC transporter permease [Phyllobacterium salinisoli]